jgi:cysteine desulfurase
VGKIPVSASNFDVISFSAHKMYGPKGVGALYVRSSHPKVNIQAQMDGGGHERGLRSGTLNVPDIVGFGKAAGLALEEMAQEATRIAELRNMLQDMLASRLDDVFVNGHRTTRLPNNLNIGFRGVRADRLIMDMKDIAVSTGSACSSASPEPSHVLRALGLNDEDIRSCVRFGLGRFTTREEIDYTINKVVAAVRRIRESAVQFANS